MTWRFSSRLYGRLCQAETSKPIKLRGPSQPLPRRERDTHLQSNLVRDLYHIGSVEKYGGKGSHLNEGNALRWQMQSFAMADAKLCESSCKALRWQLQSFAWADAKLCICDGLSWHRNRLSYSGYEKREERLTLRGHCSPQESSAKPTSHHLRMNKKKTRTGK